MDAEPRKSWLPGGLGRFGWRWPLVAVLRILWWCGQLLEGPAEAFLKRLFGTRYERTGGCRQTGLCCEIIAMDPPKFAKDRPRLRRFMVHLGEILYPFRLQRDAGDSVYYTCYNFDAERRICKNYRFRPKVCRDYPEVGYFSRPAFFKGCGFGVRLRARPGSFVEVLDRKRREHPPAPD